MIISEINFGNMLDIAKWLRLRRKCPGRDLLLTVRLPHWHRIAGNAAVVESCLTVKPPWNTVRTGRQGNARPHWHRIAGNAAVVVVAGWRICHGAACHP